MKILSFVKGNKGCLFAGGVAAGLLLRPLVKSKTAHKAAT